jgi:uncharacterized repeat protein (TIGR02543 family)
VAAITVDEGTAVEKPADPTRSGYTFQGWFSAESGGTQYTWPHTVTGNVTMHARWRDNSLPVPTQYTISFNSHGGSAVTAITADEGTVVEKPTDPTRSGYTFSGWFSAASGGTLYSWPRTLNADLTIHAQWRDNSQPAPTQYTLSFNSHGGSTVAAITVDEGTVVEKPTDPTRSGYTFNGWFSAGSGGTLYTWPHTLTADVTMHAQWQDTSDPGPTQYTISFDSHGGPAVQAITANEGTLVEKPADPTRSGYTFNGWFSAASDGTLCTWPHTLTANVTIHAQWTLISYTISYTLNGGTNGAGNPASYTVESLPLTLTAPVLTGYTGIWYDNPALTGSPVTGIPAGITGDKTFYAQWRPGVLVAISVWVNEDGAILASNDDVTIYKSPSGENVDGFTATVTGAYSGVQWYLNGDSIGGNQGTEQSIAINAADYVNGSYYLGVTVTKDGKPHSADIYFTVRD